MSQIDLVYKIESAKNLNKILDINNYTNKDLLQAMTLKPGNVMARFESIVEKKVLKDTNLSAMNLKILSVIMFLKSSTQTEILEYINTTAANLSQRINWLEKNGYVTVTPLNKSKDRRKKELKITRKAVKKVKKAFKQIAIFKKRILKHFTKKEIIQALKYFIKLSEILDKFEDKEQR